MIDSTDTTCLVSHLKRLDKNGQNWVFPQEENFHEMQNEQIILTKLNVSYPASAGRI